MTFVVTWSLVAHEQFVRLEADAVDPESVRQAAAWVDYTLRRTPLDMGELRWGGERLWYGDVLGVWYKVDDRAGTVRVQSIGPARRR